MIFNTFKSFLCRGNALTLNTYIYNVDVKFLQKIIAKRRLNILKKDKGENSLCKYPQRTF